MEALDGNAIGRSGRTRKPKRTPSLPNRDALLVAKAMTRSAGAVKLDAFGWRVGKISVAARSLFGKSSKVTPGLPVPRHS